MADLSDVEDGLVALVAGSIYPNGFDQNSAVGPDCRIFRGWPYPGVLTADLAAGKVNIAIYASDEVGRITTRFGHESETSLPLVSLTATVQGDHITLLGTPRAGVFVGLQINDNSYVYRVEEDDTPELVCAKLALLVHGDLPTYAAGNSIRVSGSHRLVARVSAAAIVRRENRRQEHDIKISCWCPTSGSRDAVARQIDKALATTIFISLSDTSQARITYKGTKVFEPSQNTMLFRRDLLVVAEYATLTQEAGTPMMFGVAGINAIHTLA